MECHRFSGLGIPAHLDETLLLLNVTGAVLKKGFLKQAFFYICVPLDLEECLVLSKGSDGK